MNGFLIPINSYKDYFQHSIANLMLHNISVQPFFRYGSVILYPRGTFVGIERY